MIDEDYEGLRRVVYDCGERFGEAWFIPVCPECGKFVKVGELIMNVNGLDEFKFESNAIYKRHDAVVMPFEGWFSREEI